MRKISFLLSILAATGLSCSGSVKHKAKPVVSLDAVIEEGVLAGNYQRKGDKIILNVYFPPAEPNTEEEKVMLRLNQGGGEEILYSGGIATIYGHIKGLVSRVIFERGPARFQNIGGGNFTKELFPKYRLELEVNAGELTERQYIGEKLQIEQKADPSRFVPYLNMLKQYLKFLKKIKNA